MTGSIMSIDGDRRSQRKQNGGDRMKIDLKIVIGEEQGWSFG